MTINCIGHLMKGSWSTHPQLPLFTEQTATQHQNATKMLQKCYEFDCAPFEVFGGKK
jgi:hypothetical protein